MPNLFRHLTCTVDAMRTNYHTGYLSGGVLKQACLPAGRQVQDDMIY